MHKFTYTIKVKLINKKKSLLIENYSKSTSDARQLSSDTNCYLMHNIYISHNKFTDFPIVLMNDQLTHLSLLFQMQKIHTAMYVH
jgi:hypothetical protein